MGEQNYSIEQDLKEAQAMADVLVPYIYEDRLYVNMGGGALFGKSNTPAMTLGALLMRLRRLRALDEQLSRTQEYTLSQVESRNQDVWNEWRQHYENKAVQEGLSRLKMMTAYFDECRESPQLCASAYMPEALRRTIVQEIALALEQKGVRSAELNREMKRMDSQLRRYAQPSGFIWSPILEPVCPKDVFWWLYGKPQG